MITDRNLKPGMTLVAKYQKKTHICKVVAVEGDKVTASMPDGKVLIVEGQYNKVKYQLEDGREFKSPSGAGMAVTGHACDGWHFWSVETTQQTAPAAEIKPPEAPQAPRQPVTETKPEQGQPPAQEVAANAKAVLDSISESLEKPSTVETPTPAGEEPGPAKKRIFRLPNQKGVPEGKVRWYCHDCGKSFLTSPGENPQTCPEGHKVG